MVARPRATAEGKTTWLKEPNFRGRVGVRVRVRVRYVRMYARARSSTKASLRKRYWVDARRGEMYGRVWARARLLVRYMFHVRIDVCVFARGDEVFCSTFV